MQFVKSKTIEIDIEKERKRILELFEGGTQDRLLKLLEMIQLGHFQEAIDFVNTWGRNPELECSEREFIATQVWDVLTDVHDGFQITPVQD